MSKESEIESTIYARMTNPAGLWQAAKIIHQEQAQIKTPKGNIRVRKERNEGEAIWNYTLTTKHFVPSAASVKAAVENTEIVNAKIYQMFKSVCPEYMRKTRFVFLIEKLTVEKPNFRAEVALRDVKYEVDVFYKADGQASEYVKIDIELQNIKPQLEAAGLNIDNIDLTAKISRLPFAPVAAFIDDKSSDKMKEFVSLLYNTQFIRKNDPKID